MYTNVNSSQFHEAFRDVGRLDNFTYQGREALFEYLEEMEKDIGEQYELDVIALCCDFSQDTYKDIAESHDIDDTQDCDDDELKEKVIDYLNDETMVVYSDDETVLYQVF